MSGRVEFALAGPADEAELRALLRDQPLPGWVSLGFEREPDYFAAAASEGERHRVLIAREATTGELAGFCARAVRRVYVDGRVERLGYLGQFRTAANWQRGHQAYRLLRHGFAEVRRRLRRDDELAYDLTSILADNRPARRILTADLPGLPHYQRLNGFHTLVYRSGGRFDRDARRVIGGDRVGLGAIATFLQECYRDYRYAPVWDRAAITAAGLRDDDFLVLTDRDRVVACAALWDQRGFKQTVVRGYRPPLGLLRPLVNLAAPLTGLAPLPPPDAPIQQAWLALLGCRSQDPATGPARLDALLSAARVRARQRGLQTLLLGLADGHPLLPAARRAGRHLRYRSDLYRIQWDRPDPQACGTAEPHRPLHLEAATL